MLSADCQRKIRNTSPKTVEKILDRTLHAHKVIKGHNLQLLCETPGHCKKFLQQAIAF